MTNITEGGCWGGSVYLGTAAQAGGSRHSHRGYRCWGGGYDLLARGRRELRDGPDLGHRDRRALEVHPDRRHRSLVHGVRRDHPERLAHARPGRDLVLPGLPVRRDLRVRSGGDLDGGSGRRRHVPELASHLGLGRAARHPWFRDRRHRPLRSVRADNEGHRGRKVRGDHTARHPADAVPDRTGHRAGPQDTGGCSHQRAGDYRRGRGNVHARLLHLLGARARMARRPPGFRRCVPTRPWATS